MVIADDGRRTALFVGRRLKAARRRRHESGAASYRCPSREHISLVWRGWSSLGCTLLQRYRGTLVSPIEFKAPGPGSWELEQTHFARPATRYVGAMFADPLARGFGEGTKRYGLLLDTLKRLFDNDFCYGKFAGVGAPENASGPPPRPIFALLTRLHPEIRRRIAAAPDVIDKKLWREDMRRWDEQYKPDSI